MKTLAILISLFIAPLVFAGDFVLKTADEEVTSKANVVLEKVVVTETVTALTGAQVDSAIYDINFDIKVARAKIKALKIELAEFVALKEIVDSVKLATTMTTLEPVEVAPK